MNIFFLIAGLIVVGVGLLRQAIKQGAGKKAQAWPTTQGVVVSSSVTKVPMGQSSMLTPAVLYSYEVGGAKHESAAYRLGAPPMFNTPAKAEAAAAKYPAGSQVTVHYDPGKPDSSALELKVGDGYIGLMIYAFGATFICFGLLGLVLRF
ncbi:MAG TPA: DUF3592 domain-containing protein [Caulobacteraceae bacterium]|jgi:hypothetical protein